MTKKGREVETEIKSPRSAFKIFDDMNQSRHKKGKNNEEAWKKLSEQEKKIYEEKSIAEKIEFSDKVLSMLSSESNKGTKENITVPISKKNTTKRSDNKASTLKKYTPRKSHFSKKTPSKPKSNSKSASTKKTISKTKSTKRAIKLNKARK